MFHGSWGVGQEMWNQISLGNPRRVSDVEKRHSGPAQKIPHGRELAIGMPQNAAASLNTSE